MKIYIRIFVTLFFITSCYNGNKNDFHIPKTISVEAKNILKKFKKKHREIKNIPEKNDLIGWSKLKKKYIEYTKNINVDVINDFSPILKEKTIKGVQVIEITPSTWKMDNRIIIYLHGGAYTMFTSKSSLYNSVPLAHYSGIKIISIDYTTAPNKKWMGILKEVTDVIIQLYKNGYKPNSVGILGDSAGGGLAVSAVLKLRNEKNMLPKAVALWSPWVDVTETGDTYQTLKDSEPTFIYSSLLKQSANAYSNIENQKNPYVSPIYGDFKKGFPSTLIQGGTKELLLSNFIRIYQKMDTSGVNVKLDIYEGLWHVFQGYYSIPESKLAISKTSKFFITNLVP